MPERSDEDRIVRLFADYCHRVDDKDIDGWLELFWPDGAIQMGRREMAGSDLRAWVESVTAQLGDSRHYCTNFAVDVDADGRSARSVCDFLLVSPGPVLAQYGRYEDILQCRDGEWRLYRRRISAVRAPTTGQESKS